jgi:hypothetical protein
MYLFLLFLQGGLFGFVAALAFGMTWEFWAAIVVNSILVTAFSNAAFQQIKNLKS